MAADANSLTCSWCGADVPADDGYLLGERPGARRAAFCRLEHVVPWSMQGPRWEPGELEEPAADDLQECARCGEALGEVRVLLVRRRGVHRIADGFCSVDHLAAWANAGGRYGAR